MTSHVIHSNFFFFLFMDFMALECKMKRGKEPRENMLPTHDANIFVHEVCITWMGGSWHMDMHIYTYISADTMIH